MDATKDSHNNSGLTGDVRDTSNKDILEQAKENPTNIFQHPILYRVIHSGCPAESDGSFRPRLRISEFETLPKSEKQTHIENHVNSYNKEATPFLSLTHDLLWALHRALCILKAEKDVAILLIDPLKLEPGSYKKLNVLRSECDLPEDYEYKFETLVWGVIPKKSIICRWPKPRIFISGLFHVFPSLDTMTRIAYLRFIGLQELEANMRRDFVNAGFQRERGGFPTAELARALQSLGMKPYSSHMKQVFMFILGRAGNIRVEERFDTAEATIKHLHQAKIDQFEQTARELTMIYARKHRRASSSKNV
ncbi:hypothetical protein F4776DRAFT_651950 [Hypoxylon sp. NC0597]|nr:hypothetical protein F4776DRAFT_651950 [Hypoxylon sp. NC0597]